jgi:imidazoleglycerol-phosphate dehydratase/histidinol-phosphatase
VSGIPVLFIEGDEALVEPDTATGNSDLAKVRLRPGVFAALLELVRAGYRLVRVSEAARSGDVPDFLQSLFASQGVEFDSTPVAEWLSSAGIDRESSRVIGDRDGDFDLAARLGVARLRLTGDDAATWPEIAARLRRPDRVAQVIRKTKETDIAVTVNLDRETPVAIATGIGFFDHMLEQVARHGGFSLDLACRGDLEVDEHHTVEDCALALGQALREALGDKRGIGRYGFVLPMDEALAQVAIDLSGRSYAVFTGHFGRDTVGGLPTELVPHFFRSLADSLGAAIHVEVRGENTHHMIEACFKGVGRALRRAFRVRGTELPSSKGVL